MEVVVGVVELGQRRVLDVEFYLVWPYDEPEDEYGEADQDDGSDDEFEDKAEETAAAAAVGAAAGAIVVFFGLVWWWD